MITANFEAYASYVTDSLTQWDLNQVLQVSGLGLVVVPEVHFSNANMDRAIVRQATMTTDGVVVVGVPNSLLQDPLRIYAHIGIYEGDTFKVVELVEIPVTPRKRPQDYQIQDEDEEIYSFKALENAIANMITREAFDAKTKGIEVRVGALEKDSATKAEAKAISDRVEVLEKDPITKKEVQDEVKRIDGRIEDIEDEPAFKVKADQLELGENLLSAEGGTLGNGWSGDFANGFAHASGDSATLEFPVASYDVAPYVLKFTASNQYASSVESCLLVSVGGSPAFEQYQDDGTVTKYFTFYPAEGGVVFTPSENWEGTITDIGLYKLDASSLLASSLIVKDSGGAESFAVTATRADLNNISIGRNTMRKVVAARHNVAIGNDVLTETATGYFNIAIGDQAQKHSVNGTRNVAVGFAALANVTNGDRNIALGSFALAAVTTGRDNVGIGADAGWKTTTGSHNVAMSNGALNANTTGSHNVAIGHFANAANTTGENNISIGHLSNGYNTTGGFNFAAGYFAHYKGTGDRFNIAIGYQAMVDHGAGEVNTDNIAIGRQALKKNVGNYNIAMGYNSLAAATTETGYNIALGYDVMSQAVASGAEGDNIVLGHSSGRNIAGNNNIALGRGALNGACSEYNIALGADALSVTTGRGNVGIGLQALKNATTGQNNVAIGYTAGSGVSTASNCICIGSNGQNVDNGVYIGNWLAYNGKTTALMGTSPVDNARLLLPAGTSETAPLKINPGTLTTTAVVGAIEFDGEHLYFVNQSGVRKQLWEV